MKPGHRFYGAGKLIFQYRYHATILSIWPVELAKPCYALALFLRPETLLGRQQSDLRPIHSRNCQLAINGINGDATE
jgi:hypothetical protein